MLTTKYQKFLWYSWYVLCLMYVGVIAGALTYSAIHALILNHTADDAIVIEEEHQQKDGK